MRRRRCRGAPTAGGAGPPLFPAWSWGCPRFGESTCRGSGGGAEALLPNFRLPGTAPNDPANAATRDDGLLCASYFFDSEESEILPCSSDESTACAQTNARVLAARAKRALAECEANNECTYKVLQDISWDEEYSIGKQISADFFYAFVTTDTGEILAHGGNPTIVGQNLGTDFGEYGEGAWKAIQNAGAQHEGFGGVATYKWPTTSCQNTENDGNCKPVAKRRLRAERFTKRCKIIKFN